jgi:geranylgeranyl pyrophosphate synthase
MTPLARSTEIHELGLTLEAEGRALRAHDLDPAHFERSLLAPAREFLSRPGKAFRARFLEAVFALAGGARGRLPRGSLEAIELLHGGSLIIDDIQDQALTRRGAPALHRQIGTGKALNIGNWLYFVALSRLHELELPPARAWELLRAAHRCLVRCHEGQALDLGLAVAELKPSELQAAAQTTSALKTGALLGFAARLGAELAGAPAGQVAALERFAERVGVALQMLDDLGSFLAEERRGKALEDLAGGRVNWVWVWAKDSLDELRFRQLTRALGRPDEHAELCVRLAEASEARGRAAIRDLLDRALTELGADFGASAQLEQLALELKRLEKSYG